MTIGILCSNPERPGWHVEDLVRAARARDLETTLLDYRAIQASVAFPEELYRGAAPDGTRDLRELDAIIVRAMPAGSLEQVVFRMDALNRLEALGTRVINPPRAIECAVDKFLATARLRAAGLRVPATSVCESAEGALESFRALGGDVVVKPIFGSEGRGIARVSTVDDAAAHFREIESAGAVIYQQEFVDHAGEDLRVLTVGERVVASMLRRSDDWRTNVSLGGCASRHEASAEEAELALAASSAVGTVLAGVDIVRAPEGELMVLEVNSSPGWRALARATGKDIAGEIVAGVL